MSKNEEFHLAFLEAGVSGERYDRMLVTDKPSE